MEISQVSRVRIVPAIKSKVADLGMPSVFGIEYSSRTGDESYVPSVTKAAGGAEENEFDDQEDDTEPEPGAPALASRHGRRINFLA